MIAAKPATGAGVRRNRYEALIEKVFVDRWQPGATELVFERTDLKRAAADLGIELPDNLGDVIYSMRFRTAMPKAVLERQPKGLEWVIELAGRSRYRLRLVKRHRIVPNPVLARIKIPDATPEIIGAYALDDEQALLARVRYNRLLDIFLGLTTYSLQNHLRTTVKSVGQIEIDELYVGIDRFGCHYVLPVQAKGGTDRISMVQTDQDMRWCAQRFPHLRCRPISAQSMSDNRIAMFELRIDAGEVVVVDERHYQLVPAAELDAGEVGAYR